MKENNQPSTEQELPRIQGIPSPPQRAYRFLLMVAALPAFLWIPAATALLAMTGKQLVFGFDDQPLWAMLWGFIAGMPIALIGFSYVCIFAWRGPFRIAVMITLLATAFDLVVFPVAGLITHWVEHPDRFK